MLSSRRPYRGGMSMKAILYTFALCGMVFAASAHADERLIGEWQLVKTSCAEKVLGDDWRAKNFLRRVFDKGIRSTVINFSHADEFFKSKNCTLIAKTNYSINGNLYSVGPLLELASPNCPKLSEGLRRAMKFSVPSLKEQGYPEMMIDHVRAYNRIKEGKAPFVEFELSDNNRKLTLYAGVEKNDGLCSGSRYIEHYERIK